MERVPRAVLLFCLWRAKVRANRLGRCGILPQTPESICQKSKSTLWACRCPLGC